IDIASGVGFRPVIDARRVDKGGSADMNGRSHGPPLTSLARNMRYLASKSIGLQPPIIDDRMRAQERWTHRSGVTREPEIGWRRIGRGRTSCTRNEHATLVSVTRQQA